MFAVMRSPYLCIYFGSMALSAIVSGFRTSRFYPIYARKNNAVTKYSFWGMFILTCNLSIDLVTDSIATTMASNGIYNHYVFAINMLATQATLLACFCCFTQMNRAMIAYSTATVALSVAVYITYSAWNTRVVLPEFIYSAYFGILAIASMLFCGIKLYYLMRDDTYPSFLGLGLICLGYYVYLQLANSFFFSETIATMLKINDLTFYLLVCSAYYLAIICYLYILKTPGNGQ